MSYKLSDEWNTKSSPLCASRKIFYIHSVELCFHKIIQFGLQLDVHAK